MSLKSPTIIPVLSKFGMPRSVIKRSDILVAVCQLDFSTDLAFIVDPTQLQGNNDQFPVLGMAVDNSLNPNPLFVITQTPIAETFTIPALSCVRLPFESGQAAKLTFYSATTGAFKVQVTLFNYVPAPCVWYPQGISINTNSSIATKVAANLPIPNSFQKQVSWAAAAGLPTIPAGALRSLIYIEGQAVRWTDDGSAPTATRGMRLVPGAYLPYSGNLANLQFIEEAASATIQVSYYSA